MTFALWLDTLISEKGIDTEQVIEVPGKSGPNFIPLSILLDTMIDFANASVIDYLRHLARAIAI